MFFTILAFSLGGVIHLIQTEKFAEIVTRRIKKKALKEFGLKLSFKRIEVKMFPPATLLKDVEVSTEKNGIGKLNVFGEEVGLYFSIFDFFSRRFQVDTLKLSSVELGIVTNKTKKNDSGKLYPDYFSEYISFRKKSKFLIKNFEFQNVDINIDETLIGVENLRASLFKTIVELKGGINLFESPLVPKELRNTDLDSLNFVLHGRETGIDVKSFSIVSELDRADISGEIILTSKKPQVNLRTELNTGIRSMARKLGWGKYIDEYPVDGVLDVSLEASGNIEDPKVTMSSEVNLIDSEFAQVDKLQLKFNEKEGDIWLDSLKVFKSSSTVELVKSIPVYNLKEKKILSQQAMFQANGVRSNDALFVLREYLDVLKGKLTGKVLIGWDKRGIFFKPQRGFRVDDFILYSPDYSEIILRNDGFSFVSSDMLLNYDLEFSFNAVLDIGKSRVIGEGLFKEDDMKVIVYESKVNLPDIGPIVGLPLEGSGTLKGFIGGPYENVTFNFLPDLKKFKVLDFNLGEIKGKVDFLLDDLSLRIKEAKGKYGSTEYNGDANFLFEKDLFNLDIKVPRGTYSDAQFMVPELLAMISKEPLDLQFNFQGDIKYQSDFDINKLRIRTKATGQNLSYLGERVDKFSLELDVDEDQLNFNKITFGKNKGQVQGTLLLNQKSKKFKYNGTLAGIYMRDFDAYTALNLGLDGRMRGEFYGEGTFDNFTSRAQIKLENSEIANRPVNDSIFTIYNKGTDVFLSANLFEGVSISEGYISFDKKVKRKSYINSRLYTKEPSLLAGVLSEHNYLNKSLKGSVDMRAELSFHTSEPEKFDFDFFVPEFDLQFQDQLISVDGTKNRFLVKNGKMENWNLRIHTTDGYFESSGKGDMAKSFQIDSRFKLNPIYLKLITPKLLSASGSITGTSIFLREKEEFSFHSETFGESIDIKLDKVPGAIRDVNFKLLSEGEDILLERMTGNYGKGTLSADGNIKLKLPFPVVNINGSINGSQIPITDRTFGVVSGNASLRGKTLPYILSGGVSVLHGEVLNEYEDFSEMIGLSEGYLRYIPSTGRFSKMDLIEYDMDFDIFNPINVKNSISDLKIDGSLKIKGSLQKPLLTGDLNILPNVSRVFFKGNEFIMSEGQLSFLDVGKKEVPEIKLAGVAKVDRYEVGLEVNGKVDKFGIKLSSTPSLDQGQILSLLVLGVPEDINQELDDAEREQIAVQGGVGLVVERFKLVKPIDSMLGLKFSVSPEFQEDDSSLLEGRLNSGDAGSSRYKSGTKVKVQKKIAEKVDVSFSSTVGGTVEETKEMNVNYNINKNLSLEGVYELRSVEEETEENPESVGADIKWKFSF